MFAIETDRQEDRVTVDLGAGSALFHIYSERGIGAAQVTLVAGSVPDRVVLRFHLRGLEEVRFSFGDISVVASVSSLEGNQVMESVTGAVEISSLTADSPYWLPITLVSRPRPGESPIPIQDGYIDVELPAAFAQGGHGSFSLHWIDFFR